MTDTYMIGLLLRRPFGIVVHVSWKCNSYARKVPTFVRLPRKVKFRHLKIPGLRDL